MAADATGTPTSPDNIARILPSDAPAVTTLTSGVNAIADTVQTALTANYPRITSKSANQVAVTNGTTWSAAALVDANIAAGANIAVTKLAAGSANTVLRGGASNSFGQVQGADIVTSVALAGSPTTTTQAVDTNTTAIATTGFVIAQATSTAPNAVGIATAAAGSSTRYARSDHTHKLASTFWDTTGTSSYLNPWKVFAYYEQSGVQTICDGVEYAPGPGGWFSSATANSFEAIPWQYTEWAQMGTVQMRVTMQFNVSVAVGGSARSVTPRFVFINESSGNSTAAADISTTSLVDGTGVRTIDTGFVAVPANGQADGLLLPRFQSNRTGGANGTVSRSSYILTIRVV